MKERKEGICPKCGKELVLEWCDTRIGPEYVVGRWECDCGAEGLDRHKLVFDTHILVGEDEYEEASNYGESIV